MNETIRTGEVFRLSDLAEYRDGQIVHVDVTQNDRMRMAIKAFDAGCELASHTAPGNVIVFALEGDAVIQCAGKEYPIEARENFFFAKGEEHGVKAVSRFKMAVVVDFS